MLWNVNEPSYIHSVPSMAVNVDWQVLASLIAVAPAVLAMLSILVRTALRPKLQISPGPTKRPVRRDLYVALAEGGRNPEPVYVEVLNRGWRAATGCRAWATMSASNPNDPGFRLKWDDGEGTQTIGPRGKGRLLLAAVDDAVRVGAAETKARLIALDGDEAPYLSEGQNYLHLHVEFAEGRRTSSWLGVVVGWSSIEHRLRAVTCETHETEEARRALSLAGGMRYN